MIGRLCSTFAPCCGRGGRAGCGRLPLGRLSSLQTAAHSKINWFQLSKKNKPQGCQFSVSDPSSWKENHTEPIKTVSKNMLKVVKYQAFIWISILFSYHLTENQSKFPVKVPFLTNPIKAKKIAYIHRHANQKAEGRMWHALLYKSVNLKETHLNGIVKDFGSRMTLEWMHRWQEWFAPTRHTIPWHLKHVVSEVFAKNQCGDIRLGFSLLRQTVSLLNISKLNRNIINWKSLIC